MIFYAAKTGSILIPFRYLLNTFLRHSNFQAAHHNPLSYIIKALLLYRIVTALILFISALSNKLLIDFKAVVLTHYLRDIEHVYDDKPAEYELQKKICNSIN